MISACVSGYRLTPVVFQPVHVTLGDESSHYQRDYLCCWGEVQSLTQSDLRLRQLIGYCNPHSKVD